MINDVYLILYHRISVIRNLKGEAMTALELYVHIPFCVRKCAYCDFPSGPPAGEAAVAAYFDALLAEIAACPDGGMGEVTTVYFGGGTPSFVAAEWIQKVLAALGEKFHFDPRDDALEKTIEVNPASALEPKLRAYRAMGFNRLSIGCQAAQDRLLAILGRPHTFADFLATYDHAVEAGFTNISADLMAGLPGQSLADMDDSLEAILDLPAIRHLSAYSLIVEPGTPFARRQARGELALPGEDTERAMVHRIKERTKGRGMVQYEISNYAYPGFESRHNTGYWIMTPYRGFGLGAASFDGRARWQNTADLAGYQAAPGVARAEDHVLPEEELRGDFMFLGLRRLAGVADGDYRRRFGRSFFDDYGSAIARLKDEGLVMVQGETLGLTDRGLDLANQVFVEFV